MPLGDGSGPLGRGPRTGRGLGRCRTSWRQRFSGQERVNTLPLLKIGTIVVPATVAVIADLSNENSILKKLGGKVLNKLSEVRTKGMLPGNAGRIRRKEKIETISYKEIEE